MYGVMTGCYENWKVIPTPTIGRTPRRDAVGKIKDYVVAIVPTHSMVNLHRHEFPL